MRININKYLKNGILYILLIVVYILLLVLSASIPNKFIKNNIIESSKQLLELGEKTTINILGKRVILFNFTDALMLNTIYSLDNDSPLESSLLARRNYIKGKTEKVYKDTNPPGVNSEDSATYTDESYQTQEFWDTVNENTTNACIEYARYWHGYIIVLKPLLLLFNYKQICLVSFAITVALTISLIYFVAKKIGIKEAIALLVSFFVFDIYISSISINAIIPFIIAFTSGIIILIDEKMKNKSLSFYFLLIGSITAYFDLLTVPLVTLGIPLIIRILLDNKNDNISIKDILKDIIFWGIGYASTIILKWIITDILLSRNVLVTSINQFIYRIGYGKDGSNISSIYAIKRNIYFMDNTYFIISAGLLIITLIYKLIIKEEKMENIDYGMGILVILPFLWISILKNHSAIHAYFTYRILIISFIISILFFLNNFKFWKEKK